MNAYNLPSHRYHCLLDEQPHYLIPRRLLQRDNASPLIVNPLCQFSWHGGSPRLPAGHTFLPGGFLDSEHIVWVSDAATGTRWPYWIGREYFGYLANFKPGRTVSENLPDHVRWVLRVAEVLVAPNQGEWRHRSWLYSLNLCEGFRRGYAVLLNFIPALHLGSLRRYYRALVRQGAFALGDEQVERRYVAHNEPVARYLHSQFTRMVSQIAGLQVKPSDSYVVAYQGGAQLERHVDRPQCEYSLTISTDFAPEPTEQCPWPINLDLGKRTVRVWQYLGEGLFYRGRRLPHYRRRLPITQSSTSLLLHYVESSFADSLD